ncbi:MAG: FAD-binding oxidoreductase [Gammaproteobacteria bacterium]|nr:FAD-binding oxidoreductase [Gammaproteobacteria bacterium]
MTAELSNECERLLGPNGWLTDEDTQPYTSDWLSRYHSTPIGVARPASADQVSQLVQLCQQHGATVTPQGGNTGMVGGSVPSTSDHRPSIILQMGRMNAIEHIDSVARSVTVQPGVVLQQLHEELENASCQLPMHLGSQGSAQIGGLLSTNAGGSHVLRYGMMQELLLGLEVVLPDGKIWSGDRGLLKDNTCYPLKKLFCGAEGTLGIITKAVLRVYPQPRARVTALLGCESLDSALLVAETVRRDAGDLVSALEFLTSMSCHYLQTYIPAIDIPLDPIPPVALLVELDTSSPYINLDEMFEKILENLLNKSFLTDGALASNEAQRESFWRIREEIPEAQRLAGAQLKHDVAVPVGDLGRFISAATEAVTAVQPGVRVNAFGHLGDGNVHFNISPPDGERDFGTLASAHRTAVYDAAIAQNGTISAEHGLGQDKVALADHYNDATERALMRALKNSLDPNNVMNPGKVV